MHEKALCKKGAAIVHNRQKRIRVNTSEQSLAYFNRNPKEFCVDLCRGMKHRSTTILRNHVKGQNSGLNLVKVHQSVRKRNNRLGNLLLVFFLLTNHIILKA